MIIAYTDIDDTAIINKIPNGQSTTASPSPTGITAHDNNAIVNPSIGAIKNMI